MPKRSRKNMVMHDEGALDKALLFFKSKSARRSPFPHGDGLRVMANKLDISQQQLSLWKNRGASVPPERCVEIEMLTKGHVKREELRPDIFVRGQERALGKKR